MTDEDERDDERKTETRAGEGAGDLAARLVVRVQTGPAAGAERVLERGSVVVGAAGDVDLVVPDKRVSRRHVELALVDGGVRVRDLGSKNGTRVNGVPVETAIVGADATVEIGDSAIVFHVHGGAAADRREFAGLTTQSAEMARLFELLARAARSEVTVLIEGETGTGKDVLARAVHRESARANGPFLVVDCGALAPTLVTSELFGHKKGAFTGAATDHAGVFEAAAGGTVFLDEIGELPLDLQPSLLRVLENREVKRVGETKARPVDVRVLAATHRDLKARVDAGAFRADLYFRLAVVRARVPPLRARREDIPALARVLLEELGWTGAPPSSTLWKRLAAHAWPGNVRELRNALASAAALSPAGGELALPELDVDAVVDGGAGAGDLRDERKRNERAFLEGLLEKHGGNVTAAAREAGVDRKHLHRLLAKHGIDAARHRG